MISEVFADAVGTDAGKEWLEIYVAAGAPVDLNGLSVVNLSASNSLQSAGVTGVDCVTAQPGQYMVAGAAGDKAANLGHATRVPCGDTMVAGAAGDKAANGGVAVNAVATGLALFGTPSLVELSWGGGLIDRASLGALCDPKGRHCLSATFECGRTGQGTRMTASLDFHGGQSH